MIDIVSGDLAKGRDWAEIWRNSPNAKARSEELEELKKETSGKKLERDDDRFEYASTVGTQLKLVTKRATVQVSSERLRWC